MSNDSPDEGRRNLLKAIGGACGACAAGVVGVPAMRALVSPVFEDTVVGASGFVPVIGADAVPEDGTPIAVPVVVQAPRDAWNVLPPTEIGTVFLRRRGRDLIALSTVCPHLGCQVDLKKESEKFHCPCHDSAFSLDGAVVGGPSPRPLDNLETRVVDGRVEVRYQRFKTGTKQRTPA